MNSSFFSSLSHSSCRWYDKTTYNLQKTIWICIQCKETHIPITKKKVLVTIWSSLYILKISLTLLSGLKKYYRMQVILFLPKSIVTFETNIYCRLWIFQPNTKQYSRNGKISIIKIIGQKRTQYIKHEEFFQKCNL